jgi:hypothetical protein
MEPYMEPVGDSDSWGFRPGRGTSHAITQIAQILLPVQSGKNNEFKKKCKDSLARGRANLALKNMNLTYEEKKELVANSEKAIVNKLKTGGRSIKVEVPKDLIVTDRKPTISHTKYLIDADIKGCFDNISHSWLIENVPMSKNYRYLLIKILKTNIVERTNGTGD